MLKFGLPVLFIFIVLLAFLTRIEAKEQTATLRGEVAAGDAYTGRLRNLPKGASLSIDATVSGEIRILLLDPEDARRWPAVEQPLFEGNTSDRMRFALQVPRSGHYFVILYNRDGDAARTFTLRIQGSTEGLSRSGVESDVDRAHDELLNGEIFYTLKEAKVLIEQWRRHYNTIRPHSALGYRPPAPAAILPDTNGQDYAVSQPPHRGW